MQEILAASCLPWYLDVSVCLACMQEPNTVLLKAAICLPRHHAKKSLHLFSMLVNGKLLVHGKV